MKIFYYVIPALLIFTLIVAIVKKINPYAVFINGVKNAVPLVLSLFPYIIAIFIMSELFEVSGLSNLFIKLTKPMFNLLGIPEEVIKLVLIKPFSGSGSLALLSEIYQNYGTTGYIPLLASTLYGSSETTFYISAVYFTKCKNKNATKGIIISLVANFISTVFSCFICRLF